MSGAGVGSHQRIEIKIIVRYEGLKATQYFSKFTSASDTIFREDLLALKLPHPKRENTTFISHGCVECVWPLVPHNGLLHKQIMTKTKPHDSHDQKALKTLLGNLSISALVAKEIYPDVGKARKNLKRPNPFTSEEGALSKSEGYGHRIWSRPLPEKPHASAPPKVAAAEAFLQDMKDSLRPHKIPKLEPVDVPLPLDPPTRLGRTLEPFRSTSSLSSNLSLASKATNPPESTSSLSPFVSQQTPRAKALVSNVPPSHAKSVSLPIKPIPTPIKDMLRELQPFLTGPPSLPAPAQPQCPAPDPKTTLVLVPLQLKISASDPKTTPIPVPQRPLQHDISASDPKTTSIPVLQKPLQPKIPVSDPKTTPIPPRPLHHKIHQLTRELYDIRRENTANTIREAAIILELKQLNAAFIPRPLKVDVPGTGMEGRMKKLEQELDTERKMRLEAEHAIKDIRRESKAPFVVPALLDAFIKLSKLTTQASHLNGTAAAKDNG